jgi:hypothetical protein
MGDYWALPGGFMFRDEDAYTAASRILKLRTGVSNVYLKQFHLFSDPKRADMNRELDFSALDRIEPHEFQWIMHRFVTLGYYALVRYDDIHLINDSREQTAWHPVNDLPHLYSDHSLIIHTAMDTIRDAIEIIPLGVKLLPDKFTFPDLRMIYEIFSGKRFDRRNFQRKVMSEDCIQEVGKMAGRTYNAPILYSFCEASSGTIRI